MATFTSKRPQVQQAFEEALSVGLSAAGHEYGDRVGRRLAFGYTSGDFVTGHVAKSVEVTPVERTADGLEVRVGSNVDYALFWELGHFNIFTASKTATVAEFFTTGGFLSTGGFQRVEIWRPFLLEMAEQLRETVRSTAVAVIAARVGRGTTPVDVVTGQTREQKRQAMRNLVDK